MLGVVCSLSSAANPIRFSFNNNNKSHTSTSTRLRAASSIPEFPLASKIVVTSYSVKLGFKGLVVGGGTSRNLKTDDLSHSTSDAFLKKKFSNFGQVVEVKLVTDESGKRSKGFAFVQYTCQDDAVLALESMDRKYVDGRLVYVDIAKPVTSTFGAYPRTSGPPRRANYIGINN